MFWYLYLHNMTTMTRYFLLRVLIFLLSAYTEKEDTSNKQWYLQYLHTHLLPISGYSSCGASTRDSPDSIDIFLSSFRLTSDGRLTHIVQVQYQDHVSGPLLIRGGNRYKSSIWATRVSTMFEANQLPRNPRIMLLMVRVI